MKNVQQPANFTRDRDFYDRRLCHAQYCLIYLAIQKQEVAIFVRRFLRHKTFNPLAKRLERISFACRAPDKGQVLPETLRLFRPTPAPS
jgi:hypothetical protein